MSKQAARWMGVIVVLAHLAITLWHGAAHRGAEVTLSPIGYLYVAVVITLAPLVATVMLFTRADHAGAWLLMLSMLGSLVFGLLYHFVLPGADNVVEVHAPWHGPFLASAIAVAGSEFGGTIIGLWLVRLTRSGLSLQR